MPNVPRPNKVEVPPSSTAAAVDVPGQKVNNMEQNLSPASPEADPSLGGLNLGQEEEDNTKKRMTQSMPDLRTVSHEEVAVHKSAEGVSVTTGKVKAF